MPHRERLSLPLRTLAQIVDAFDAVAFVQAADATVLVANCVARACACREPGDLAASRASQVQVECETVTLVVGSCLHVHHERARGAPWSVALRLPPSLAPVAALAARGLADKEIAAVLAMSLATVRTYVRRAMRRVGVCSRMELRERIVAAMLRVGCAR